MFNAILTVFLALLAFAVGIFLFGCFMWLFADCSGRSFRQFWKEF